MSTLEKANLTKRTGIFSTISTNEKFLESEKIIKKIIKSKNFSSRIKTYQKKEI